MEFAHKRDIYFLFLDTYGVEKDGRGGERVILYTCVKSNGRRRVKLEFSPMIFVRIEVGRDNDSVVEFSSG